MSLHCCQQLEGLQLRWQKKYLGIEANSYFGSSFGTDIAVLGLKRKIAFYCSHQNYWIVMTQTNDLEDRIVGTAVDLVSFETMMVVENSQNRKNETKMKVLAEVPNYSQFLLLLD